MINNSECYVAGLYARLSNEKIENSNSSIIEMTEDERESGSISNQKIFLKNFCKQNNIRIYDIYADDGYSGANFERPSFKRMILDIEAGKINMVIVKDLSRFARTSLGIDKYLDEYFIEKGVRFIAVADTIDTGYIETSEEMVKFKAFFNEWTLRDMSKKVKNGRRIKANEGKVMTTYATYGYKKDPLDKNHYIIDKDIAPIVRKIFETAKKGITPTQIAVKLTENKIPVPSEIVGNAHTRDSSEIKRGWTRNAVLNILQNETYLGYVRNGTLKKLSYKSKKIVSVPRKDWIVKKGMHEPIIDEETFNIVQQQIKSRAGVRNRKYDWLLKGILCCKECGKKLSVIPAIQKNGNRVFYLRCNTYATMSSAKLCTPHSNNYDRLMNIILDQIRERCKGYFEKEKLLSVGKKQLVKSTLNSNMVYEQITELKNKIKSQNKKIDMLYEDRAKGILLTKDFKRIYNSTKDIIKSYELSLKNLTNQNDKKIKIDLNELIKKFIKMEYITRDMIVSLVEKIEISENGEIKIYYKFYIPHKS